MLSRLFRRTAAPVPPTTPVAASKLASHGAEKRRAAARKIIRDRADQMRADMRARGIDKPAIDWSAL